MVNTLRLRRYMVSGIILPLLIGLFILSGCENDDTITGTGSGLSNSWHLIDLAVDATEFRAISFSSNDKGFLVGLEGAIIMTADGGANWQQYEPPTAGTLWDVEFLGDTGVIVGDQATVLRSIDGGATWNAPVMGGGITDIFGLEIANEELTWIVGATGLIAASNNAGWNWSIEKYYLQLDTTVGSIDTLPDSTIDTTMAYDTNWITIGDPGTFENLREVEFLNLAEGVIVGDNGTIVTTSDSGQTWSPPATNPATENLYSVARSGTAVLVAVGDGGAIYRSTNSGADWSAVSDTNTVDLRSVTFADASNGWITGYNGVILSTSDAGATWTNQTSGTHLQLWGVSFPSPTVGWIAGEFTILNTMTSGTTWSRMISNSLDIPTLLGIDFFDANNGWAVGHAGAIVLTTNAGATWSLVQFRGDAWLHDVEFVSADEGWAVGGQGVSPFHAIIQHTTDGGLTWTEQTNLMNVIDTFKCSTMDTTWLMALEMINATTGFAVGGKWEATTGGLCLKTTNSGATWTRVSVLPDTTTIFVAPGDVCNPGQSEDTVIIDRANRFSGLHFIDENEGWGVGAGGMIVHTTDGGATWERQNDQYTCVEVDENDPLLCLDSILVYMGYLNYDLNDVHFISSLRGWAIGSTDSLESNVVLSTTDGGDTWTRLNLGSGTSLSSIKFVDGSATTGWMVGSGGVAFATTNSGDNWTEVRSGAGDLTDVHPFSANNVWVIGEDGLLIQTTTGGR